MKAWKHKIKRLSALMMAAVLFAGSVDYTAFPVFAEEAEEQPDANLTSLEDPDSDTTPEQKAGLDGAVSEEERNTDTVLPEDNDGVSNDNNEQDTPKDSDPTDDTSQTDDPQETEPPSDDLSTGDDPSGQTPDTEDPSDQTPEVKDPSDQTPDTEDPSDQTPEMKDPSDQTPEAKDPSDQTPDNPETGANNPENPVSDVDEDDNEQIPPETEPSDQEQNEPNSDMLSDPSDASQQPEDTETEDMESEEDTITEIETELIDLGDTLTSAPGGASFFSLSNGTVDLKSGSYVNWIDRIDLPDYAREFYQTLVEASDGDGIDDFLIEDKYFSTDTSTTIATNVHAVKFTTHTCSTSNVDVEKEYITNCMRAVYDAFDRDHPEVFWLSGRTSAYMTSSSSASTGKTTLNFYFMLKSDNFDIRSKTYPNGTSIKNAIQKRKDNISRILSTVSNNGDNESLVKALNNWLTTHNEYNTDLTAASSNYPDAWECVSALEGRTGGNGPVCEGYARAFKVLCDQLAIPCVLVDGNAMSSPTAGSGAHMWNYVEVDGNWYAVDVTWNDPVVYGTSGAVSGYENEEWLLLCSDSPVDGNWTFIESHPVSNRVSVGGVVFSNGPQLATTADNNKTSISGATVALSSGNVTYNGKAQSPGVTLTLNGQTLTKDKDYTVSYQNNTNAGTATVIIKAIGNYRGEISRTFQIAKAANAITLSKTTYTYNASSSKVQTFSIGATAKAGTVSYKSDKTSVTVDKTGKVTIPKNFSGTVKITVSASGNTNYNAATAKTVTLQVNQIANTITASSFTKTASTAAQSFSIGAKRNGSGKITYSSNNKSVTVDGAGKVTIAKNFVGKATITIKVAASGIYKAATKTITVTVNQAAGKITASNFTKTASTAAQSFSLGVKRSGSGKITYSSNNKSVTVNSSGKVTIAKNFVGKATITIKVAASGIYKAATKTITITVNQAAGKITASNFTKTTSAKAQSFSIGAKRSGSGRITYSSNNKSVTVNSSGKVTIAKNFVGKATITIKVAASGIYKAASKTITVTVNPANTSISSVKNSGTRKMTVTWKKSTAVTGYQIQYSTDKTFKTGVKTTTVSKNSTVSAAISSLTKGKTYYVRIRTYKTVSGTKYYSGWSSPKTVKITK